MDQTTHDEIVSRYVTAHAATVGGRKAVELGQAAAQILAASPFEQHLGKCTTCRRAVDTTLALCPNGERLDREEQLLAQIYS